MKHIADRFVAVLDANVLYPFRKRDILLQFSHAGLYRARWSSQILDEWTRSLLKRMPDCAESIHSQQRAMRDEFPDAIVTDHMSLVDALDLPDPDDRHVLAAGIRCGAQHIVTENLVDFPTEKLQAYDIKPIGADEFLSRTFDLYQAKALECLRDLRAQYENPRYSALEFIMDLNAKGLPKLARRASNCRDLI